MNGFESGEHKYDKKYPLWEILDFAAREGFDGVGLVQAWPQGLYPADNETERIRALKRMYDQYGLRIFSIQNMADGAFDPSADVRRNWFDLARDRAAFASAVGCAHMGFWPGGDLRGQTLDAALYPLSEPFREANTIIADHGMVAGFEIEPPFVFHSEEHMLRIMAGSGIKALYDPSHCDLFNGSTGHPHEVLQRPGVKNIACVNLTDTDGTLRDNGTSKHLPVGDGHANTAESLRVLREGGFDGWIMMDS